MQDKKYWAVYSRAGKLEGVKLCANGACEMEWRLRHAYNNEKPFKIVAGWEAEQHRAESSVEQLQAEFDAVLEVTR